MSELDESTVQSYGRILTEVRAEVLNTVAVVAVTKCGWSPKRVKAMLSEVIGQLAKLDADGLEALRDAVSA